MNATPRTDQLARFLSDRYALPEPIDCEFIGRGFNDHYVVRSRNEKYFLRAYLNGKYYIDGPEDFRFELNLLDFLVSRGAPVVRPISNTAGERLSTIETTDGERHIALFEYAEGEPMVSPVVEKHAEGLGQIVATIHSTADVFHTEDPRYDLDLHYLLDEPLRLLEHHLDRHGMGDLSFFLPFADEMRQKVERLGKVSSAYGIIHGDLIPSNILYKAGSGITILDFDHCGYGWRGYDLETLISCYQNPVREAIKRGYESVRPLSVTEAHLMSTFNTLRWKLWNIGDVLGMTPAWDETPDQDYLRHAQDTLRSLATR